MKEAGLLVYDIPLKSRALACKMPSLLKPYAIHIQQSGWLFDLSCEPKIREIYNKHKDSCNIYLLPIAFLDDTDLKKLVKDCLIKRLRWVPHNFNRVVAKLYGKISDLDIDKREARLLSAKNKAEKYLSEATTHAALFGLTGDLEKLLEGATKTIQALFEKAKIDLL